MKIFFSLIISVFIFLSGSIYAGSLLQSATDSVNSGIVNTKMATDNKLDNINIDATVVNGIAIFSGNVHSKAQVDELVRIAHSVSGIKGVDVSKVQIK